MAFGIVSELELKMKLRDVIENIDKSESNEANIDLDDIYSVLLNIFDYDWDVNQKIEKEKRLKSYWMHVWYCTDTWVGSKVYIFDDIPVLVSSQTARKSDNNIDIIKCDKFNELITYLQSFIRERETSLSIANLDEEVDEYYSLYYPSSILHRYGYYNGNRAKILMKHETLYGSEKQKLTIQYVDDQNIEFGEHFEINTEELFFKVGKLEK